LTDRVLSLELEIEIANLKKEIEELKQANTNIIQFTFSISNSLDETGRVLVKAGNALFVISDRLKAIVNQSNKSNAS
jgi:hypothetical protein